MDTLDYTGHDFNKGSKLVIAVAGEKRRQLCRQVPENLILPDGYDDPRLILPGLLTVCAPAWPTATGTDPRKLVKDFCEQMDRTNPDLMHGQGVAWIVLVDDGDFCARSLENFLWVCFLRSNPGADTYGLGAFCRAKHWGCEQSLITDARIKPHHTAVLKPDPDVEKLVSERL